MFDQCAQKTDIIDAFAMGARYLVAPAIVPGFIHTLGINHEKPVAIGQLVKPSTG
jgi:hypothetical protein